MRRDQAARQPVVIRILDVHLVDQHDHIELAIGQVDVAQQAVVLIAVGVLRVGLELDHRALGHALREGRRFLSEILDGLLRMHRLGGVHADQAAPLDFPCGLHLERVAIHDPNDAGLFCGPGKR